MPINIDSFFSNKYLSMQDLKRAFKSVMFFISIQKVKH